VKNPVLLPTDVVGPHGASSKEKALLAIHPLPFGVGPRSSERGILAFSREPKERLEMSILDTLQYAAMPLIAINIDKISIQPGPYCMSYGYDPAPLLKSVERVGLLNPPLLAGKSAGCFSIVSGYRRVVAARSLGWEKILCRDLSATKMTPFELLLLNLYDNLSTRSFNEVEKAMVLKRLSSQLSQEELIRDYLPLLGLPPHEPILRTYLLFEESEEPVKEGLAKGTISGQAAKLLLQLDVRSRLALYKCISDIRLNSNYQKQLIEYVLEISEIENQPIPEILAGESLVQIIRKEGANNPQKAKLLLEALRAMRNPRLADAEHRFRRQLSFIHLPPGARITHPPCFEAPAFTLEISFKDGKNLKDKIAQISEAGGIENIRAPWLESYDE